MKLKISQGELDILYLPKRLSAIEVCKKIRLPQKSNYTDKVDVELTPYLKLPLSLIGKSSINWIYIIAPTQSGKTVFLQVAVADCIDQDPGTLIYILPDETSGKKAIKEKVIGMIESTPDLYKHVRSTRDLSTTGIHLDNMSIYPAWSGSLATMSSIPAKRVILDEIRLMKLQIGDESNAIKLGNDRLTTYLHMGLGQGYGVSTPSIEGDLLHQQLDIVGTLVVKWAVQCLNCGKVQVLDFFKNMSKEGECLCVACKNPFKDNDMKKETNATGRYMKVNDKGELLDLPKEIPSTIICWFTSMDSPFRSFKAIRKEFEATKDKLHDYKNFYQGWLAKFWVDDISKTSIISLKERIVDLEKGIVPEWCKLITGGIDSQDDGFYITIRAWGTGGRTFLIDAFYSECMMAITTADDIQCILERELENRILLDKKGTKWQIGMYAIDTGGHRTKEIYEATNGLSRAILVKGKDNQNATISHSKVNSLYLVRTVEYLEETEIKSQNELFELPKNISEDYLRHFINRRKTIDKNKKTGEEKVLWKSVGRFDYRMADIHSFICLDIPTSEGTFRRELSNSRFSFNPLLKRVEENATIVNEDPVEDSSNDDFYNIGSFKEGW